MRQLTYFVKRYKDEKRSSNVNRRLQLKQLALGAKNARNSDRVQILTIVFMSQTSEEQLTEKALNHFYGR